MHDLFQCICFCYVLNWQTLFSVSKLLNVEWILFAFLCMVLETLLGPIAYKCIHPMRLINISQGELLKVQNKVSNTKQQYANQNNVSYPKATIHGEFGLFPSSLAEICCKQYFLIEQFYEIDFLLYSVIKVIFFCVHEKSEYFNWVAFGVGGRRSLVKLY